jgi:hypothetical protein
MTDCKLCSTPVDTMSDLTYAVQQICLRMHDPRDSHLAALKCLLRYVRGTVDFGLVLHRSFR